jgi:signal transduction histidine kinase
MKKERDSRVKVRHPSWKVFLPIFSTLLVLGAGQSFIYGAYIGKKDLPIPFLFATLGYWATVTLLFGLLINRQVFQAYDKPMRTLSEAAKQVAGGDFSVRAQPIHKSDQKDYVDVMFEDFNKMVQELGSIETLKSDFVADVSHEIKTPLSVIQSYTMALQKADLTTEMRKEYTTTIITASQKLTALITNILKLNRLENQQIIPSTRRYDLCRQLCDCALSFEELWLHKQIEFVADIEDRALIVTDDSMLEIVWNNLLSNALKFTGSGGKVTLTQRSGVDTVSVTIHDTGCGMSEETMQHIFEKFYQSDTSHSGEGNGLGLALAQRVIELVGGTISVKSEPGKGTMFTVTLKAS